MESDRLQAAAAAGDPAARRELIQSARRRGDAAPLVALCRRLATDAAGARPARGRMLDVIDALSAAGDAPLFDALYRESEHVAAAVRASPRRCAWRFEVALWRPDEGEGGVGMTLDEALEVATEGDEDLRLDVDGDTVLRVHAPELGEPVESDPREASAMPVVGGSLGAYAHQSRRALKRMQRGEPALIAWPLLGAPHDTAIVLRSRSSSDATVDVVGLGGAFVFFDRPFELGARFEELGLEDVHRELRSGWLAPIVTGEAASVSRHERWCRRTARSVFPRTWLLETMERLAVRVEDVYHRLGARPQLRWYRG